VAQTRYLRRKSSIERMALELLKAWSPGRKYG